MGQFVVPAYAGMLLAEQGHDVIKWLGGAKDDPILGLLHGPEMWRWINEGKLVMTSHAKNIVNEPFGFWDIIIDNIRAQAWESWGIDPAAEAERLGVRWVSMRDEFDGRSFDGIAQARAWGDHLGYVPVYFGDTAGGLMLAFKALAMQGPGHAVVRQATCLAKLVEGEGVVTPARNGKTPPWDRPGDYGPEGDGVTVMYAGEPVPEPFRDEKWRRENLPNRNGRYVI